MTEALAAPLQSVALPAFAEIQDDLGRLRNAFYSLTEVTALAAMPAFCGVAALAPTLVPLFFGAKWVSAVPLLQALAVWGFLCMPLNFGHPLMLAVGRPGIYLVLAVSQTALTLGLCLLAIRWNAVAVAWAVSVSMAIHSMVFLLAIRWLTGISVRAVVSRLWAPALVSAAMSGAVLVFQELAREHLGDPLTLVSGIGLGALVYGLGISLLRPELVRQFRQTWRFMIWQRAGDNVKNVIEPR